MPPPKHLRWDLYCHVIDNLGDAGVCWRLATNLAAGGDHVRLVIDDPAPLALLAPQGARGVEVHDWPGPRDGPADVVVEAFGCDLPPARVEAMAAMPARAVAAGQRPAPVWLNLEYLSAERSVERLHGLPSPQPNGLTKWFYYPGFTPRTGGLLRERTLMADRQAFDRDAWLAAQGLALRPGEQVVTLFCYCNAQIPLLLQALAARPTLLLLTPGHAQAQVPAAAAHGGLRLHALPWLEQPDFDRLLWCSDLNVVRGEDSLVRALWAGAPCLWQLYPQHDGAHLAKLQAVLDWMQAPDDVAAWWRAWNAAAQVPMPPWPAAAAWRDQAVGVRERLLQQTDLATQLRAFVAEKRNHRW